MVREKSMIQFREYDENIIHTVREPLIVLDQDLSVVLASRSFYDFFKANLKRPWGSLFMTSAINIGISPSCGNCWKPSFPKRQRLTNMRLSTILPPSADAPRC